jgi:hypothetical protein
MALLEVKDLKTYFYTREGPSGWWLVTRTSQFSTGGSYPGLLAHIQDRRVAAFHVRYPAGGD